MDFHHLKYFVEVADQKALVKLQEFAHLPIRYQPYY